MLKSEEDEKREIRSIAWFVVFFWVGGMHDLGRDRQTDRQTDRLGEACQEWSWSSLLDGVLALACCFSHITCI